MSQEEFRAGDRVRRIAPGRKMIGTVRAVSFHEYFDGMQMIFVDWDNGDCSNLPHPDPNGGLRKLSALEQLADSV